jgi:hypothetical protein
LRQQHQYDTYVQLTLISQCLKEVNDRGENTWILMVKQCDQVWNGKAADTLMKLGCTSASAAPIGIWLLPSLCGEYYNEIRNGSAKFRILVSKHLDEYWNRKPQWLKKRP